MHKYRKLIEREKLQQQVNDLMEKLNKQNETNLLAQKRLSLEAKSGKQQLSAEIQKHKSTQSQLNVALSECERLNSIIEVYANIQYFTYGLLLIDFFWYRKKTK